MIRGSNSGRKSGLFRQESVAGMDGCRLCLRNGVENGINLEITRRVCTDANGFVGGVHKRSHGVGSTVDCDSGNVQTATCLHDALGYFTAIGNEDFRKVG